MTGPSSLAGQAPSTGRLNEPSAVRSLQFDDVVATYVVDGVLGVGAVKFFPAIPTDYWSSDHGLFDAGSRIVMSAGGLLIERDGRALLIDAGLGPTTADSVVGPVNSGAMLDVLAALGRRREDIEVLAFTHLHFDHTGWAFRPNADGRYVSTFPNARYVLSAQEWGPHEYGEDAAGVATPREIIAPLAANHTVLVDGEEIFPGVRAVVTPGHSPGHTSYVVTSATTGTRLVVFGDAFHIPAQLAHPDWPSAPDIDVRAVRKARRRVLDELTQPNTIGFAFHFGDQAFGRVTTGAAGPAWEPVATTVLAPAPRTFRYPSK
jgi:glyoxylase-like metal-dependent hydrolase (beta-lactamase superfamily II)